MPLGSKDVDQKARTALLLHDALKVAIFFWANDSVTIFVRPNFSASKAFEASENIIRMKMEEFILCNHEEWRNRTNDTVSGLVITSTVRYSMLVTWLALLGIYGLVCCYLRFTGQANVGKIGQRKSSMKSTKSERMRVSRGSSIFSVVGRRSRLTRSRVPYSSSSSATKKSVSPKSPKSQVNSKLSSMSEQANQDRSQKRASPRKVKSPGGKTKQPNSSNRRTPPSSSDATSSGTN